MDTGQAQTKAKEQVVPNQTREQRRDQLSERLFQAAAGVFDTFSVYVGHRLGFYKILASSSPMTSLELSAAAGTVERYTREWLEQQTVTGILEVINPSAPAMERRFTLPAGHDETLIDRDSPGYMIPLVQLLVSVTRPIDSLLNAYRTGEGIPLSEYGEDFIYGQGDFNRVTFLQELGQVWLPSIPDVHARLQADPPARVADIGVGTGWSSIAMALSYPKIEVDGFDLDAPSIAEARKNALKSGVAHRVHFYVRDAADPQLNGTYDLVTAFETLHDMPNPIGALQTMRRMANDTGTVLIVDERVGDEFTPNGNEVEWMMYGWSFLHCLPVGMSEQPSAGTGTVMRTSTLRDYARQAGFADLEVLPIENYFFRVYRLRP
ncbi:MAG: methyltransferase domain-containing protein [Chloroflexi bacterium]|nr:methyltransferase domain-containing protein [Chloroflexota bacterium]